MSPEVRTPSPQLEDGLEEKNGNVLENKQTNVDSIIPEEARATEVIEYTAAENSRVRWKIDMIVLPCIVIASE